MVKEYDARGNYTKISYYDDKDNLTMTNEGIAMACYEYDEMAMRQPVLSMMQRGSLVY